MAAFGGIGLNYQILLNRLGLPQKVGQLGDIRRDPPRLIARKQFRH
jgi:hypothetical protein